MVTSLNEVGAFWLDENSPTQLFLSVKKSGYFRLRQYNFTTQHHNNMTYLAYLLDLVGRIINLCGLTVALQKDGLIVHQSIPRTCFI